MDLVVILVVVAAVAWLLAAPLRRNRMEADEAARIAERDELEALKEAKYREIRDAELDHRTGKLSAEDWRAMDRRLRAEAIDLLRRLDEAESTPPGQGPSGRP